MRNRISYKILAINIQRTGPPSCLHTLPCTAPCVVPSMVQVATFLPAFLPLLPDPSYILLRLASRGWGQGNRIFKCAHPSSIVGRVFLLSFNKVDFHCWTSCFFIVILVFCSTALFCNNASCDTRIRMDANQIIMNQFQNIVSNGSQPDPYSMMMGPLVHTDIQDLLFTLDPFCEV